MACEKEQSMVDSLNVKLDTAQTNLKQTKSQFWKEEVKNLQSELDAAEIALTNCRDKGKPPAPAPKPFSGVRFKDPCAKEKTALDSITEQWKTAVDNMIAKKGDQFATEEGQGSLYTEENRLGTIHRLPPGA